jgi:uncharacterized repeat protein (TIGR03803 family)
MIRLALLVAASTAMLLGCVRPAAAHLRTLYSFCAETNCTDGKEPSDGIAVDAHGNIYGTTEFGGDANHGTVFELVKGDAGAFTFAPLYSFCAVDACTDGALPLSGVILDASGNIYGTTRLGGDANVGTVFELSPSGGSWNYSVLHSFCANCTDGANPNGLMLGRGYATVPTASPTGPALYGTTYHGGDAAGGTGLGTVFQLTRAGGVWTENVIYAFCQSGCSSGANPQGRLTMDSAGTIYGTTVGGGATSGGGVVFSLAYAGAQWNQTVLYSFCATGNCPDGATPFAGVTRDASGIFYGTTGSGGATNGGTLYQLAYDGTQWNETLLYSFCAKKNCLDGKQPQSQLYLDKTDALFGTTFQGGGAGAGAIFRWSNAAYARPYSFCQLDGCADGKLATGTLAADKQGNLYGATFSGGAFGQGTVYEFQR